MTIATAQILPRRAYDSAFVEQLRRGFVNLFGDDLPALTDRERQRVNTPLTPGSGSGRSSASYVLIEVLYHRLKRQQTSRIISIVAGVAGSVEPIRRHKGREEEGSEGSRRPRRTSGKRRPQSVS